MPQTEITIRTDAASLNQGPLFWRRSHKCSSSAQRRALNGDLPDIRPIVSVTRQALRIRSQKPRRHTALSRRRDQCQPPIAGVPPHSSLIVEASVRLPRHWFQWGNQFAETVFIALARPPHCLVGRSRRNGCSTPYAAVL